jgi:hypothetical protein
MSSCTHSHPDFFPNCVQPHNRFHQGGRFLLGSFSGSTMLFSSYDTDLHASRCR